ncbi:F-box/FBD/LRR-repeat protein-like protein [Tanacetum coccineum]
MERINGKRKASPQEDFISSMPDIIITNILNRLPIDEAVRTSILSTYWRSKWTMLTQLNFGFEFYYLLEEKGNERSCLRIISRLLLHLKGPITKFVLYLDDEESCFTLEIEDIKNWVVFLSELDSGLYYYYLGINTIEASARLFACLELKHLTLHNSCFCPMSSFLGFPNLLSLDLSKVVFESCTCGEFVTQSPLLEDLKLNLNTTDKIKHVEIAKLQNLKVLRLTLCELEDMTTSSILQLMGGFQQLQDLYLDFRNCKLLADDAEKRVPTSLPCLKKLSLCDVDFSSAIMVSFAVELICGSPYLETLVIWAKYEDDVLPPAAEVDFSIMGQLQLQNVSALCLRGLVNELCLIKSLLACSPLLKKMTVRSNSKVFGGQLMLAKRLLTLHRASPIAEIKLS